MARRRLATVLLLPLASTFAMFGAMKRDATSFAPFSALEALSESSFPSLKPVKAMIY